MPTKITPKIIETPILDGFFSFFFVSGVSGKANLSFVGSGFKDCVG